MFAVNHIKMNIAVLTGYALCHLNTFEDHFGTDLLVSAGIIFLKFERFFLFF